MNFLVRLLFLILRKFHFLLQEVYSIVYNKMIFAAYNIKIGNGYKINGTPIIHTNKNGIIEIGENFKMNNGNRYNLIGRQQKCMLISKGKLKIGNNVGISSTAIICSKNILIGNNTKIGGNTVIYDTDFHSLDYIERSREVEDIEKVLCKDVYIGDNVFIGAHSTILKGVKIGNKAIIGACSLITKDIPEGEVWGGNPARFIKKLYEN